MDTPSGTTLHVNARAGGPETGVGRFSTVLPVRAQQGHDIDASSKGDAWCGLRSVAIDRLLHLEAADITIKRDELRHRRQAIAHRNGCPAPNPIQAPAQLGPELRHCHGVHDP